MPITKGLQAEQLAQNWLTKQRIEILERNFHSRWGEIDIIAIDKSTICFIEVRYRKSAYYGTAAESVTLDKQRRIIKTAQAYLIQNKKHSQRCARFDVLSMAGDLDKPEIDWYKDAFMMLT